jgi:hypothetical protein
MTSNDNQDEELLERYRRASDAQAAAPSDAVRAAILAEGRRAAEQHAKDARGRPIDSSQPAANGSRWKLPVFGTAGAALVAALLFAPRLWHAPPTPPASSATVATSAEKAAPSAAVSPDSRAPSQESVQEQVMPQTARGTSTASAQKRRTDSPWPPQNPKAEAFTPSPGVPAEKTPPPEFAAASPPVQPPPAADAIAGAPAVPPVSADARLAANSPAATVAQLASSMNAGRLAHTRSGTQPAALQSAAAAGDIVQTTALLDKGAPLNERDDQGRTPLMLAVMQNRPDIVQLLLDRGADPNIVDSIGRSPLQQAQQAKLPEIAAMLQRAGAR